MDIDILDALEELGYSGNLTNDGELKTALELGPKSVEFTVVTSWLSAQLQILCDLEAIIHSVEDSDESSSFLVEVSSFLKELHCPYVDLVEGNISQRLGSKENRITFLNFLCSELRAARILYSKRESERNSLDITLNASDTAGALNTIISKLKVNVDFSESPKVLFEKIQDKVTDVDPKLIQEPIFEGHLSSQQWGSLEGFHEQMQADYKIRRQMLLNRLDVTIMSFKWGENCKGKGDLIAKKFLPLRSKMKTEPSVNISDILAARKDIIIIEKTSSSALVRNTNSAVNKVMIGDVPDRGGRPKEQRPPVEMPGWSKRSDRGGGRGSFNRGKQFRGRGGGERGGKEWKKSKRAFDAAGSY